MTYQPTDSELDDALVRATKVFEDLYQNESDGSGSVYDNVADFLANVNYASDSGVRAAITAFRSGLSASIVSLARPVYDRILSGYLFLAGKGRVANPMSARRDLLDYFVENNKHIQLATITKSFSKVGGTGTPTAFILDTDVNGNSMTASDPGVYRVTVEVVEPDARPGEETLEFELTPRIDLFSFDHRSDTPPEFMGPGGPKPRIQLNNSGGILGANHSFDSTRAIVSAGSLNSLASWTPNDGNSVARAAIVADGYRPSVSEEANYRQDELTNTRALCLEASAAQGDIHFFKRLSNLQADVPYYGGIWVKRRNSATGDVIVYAGAQSNTLDISTISNDVWTFVPFTATTAGSTRQLFWGEKIRSNNAKFGFYTDTIGTGQIRFDAAVFIPMVPLNGVYVHFEPGATQLLDDYTGTLTFGLPVDRKIARWLHWVYPNLGYLPAYNGAVGVTASGGRTLTFAASGSTITASSGSFVTEGYVVGMKLTVAGTSSNNGTYTIASVSATVIEVEESLTNEGPLSSTATLAAVPNILDPS